MSDATAQTRARIAEAIGGRSKAGAFELESGGRFKRLTLQSWIDGRTSPALADLAELAAATKRSLAWLLDIAAAPPPGVVGIALVDAQASAGHGAFNYRAVEIARIPFPEEWLRKLGGRDPERCDFLRVLGDSMEPTIAAGALLLIDRDQTAPPKPRRGRRKPAARDDDIFVFLFEGDLRVKRLASLEPGRLAILSDNAAAYPIDLLSKDESARVKVLGRVIWWDNRL